MRSKSLIGLFVVTIVAVVLAAVLSSGGGRSGSDPLAGTAVLPEVGKRLGDVGRVALVRGDAKTTLVRQGDHWVVEEKNGYPADAGKIRQTLFGLAELRFVEAKTRKAEFYPRLAVEDADKKDAKSTLVTVADAQGSLLGEVIAGKRKVDELGGGVDGVYVRKPGDAQSWLARGTLDLSGETPAWLDRKLIDLPVAQVKELIVTQPDGSKVTLERDKAADPFQLVELPKDKKVKSPTALEDAAGALGSLELADVRPAKDVEFPVDQTATAKFTTFDGMVLTVQVTDKDKTSWVHVAAAGTGAAEKPAADLTARLGPWSYAIGPYPAGQLRAKLGDLLEQPKGS